MPMAILHNEYKSYHDLMSKYREYISQNQYDRNKYDQYLYHAKQIFIAMKNCKLTKTIIDQFIKENPAFNVNALNELDIFVEDLISFLKPLDKVRKSISYQKDTRISHKKIVTGRQQKINGSDLFKKYDTFTYLMDKYKGYLIIRGLSKNTNEAYLRNVRKFFVTLNNRSINQKLISDYFMDYREEHELSTINQLSSSLNDVIEFAKEMDLFDASIKGYKLCSAKSYHRKIPEIVSETRMEQILDNLKATRKDWLSYRDYAIFIFFYATGVRVSELLNLAAQDIQEDQWVRVNSGKGSKDRIVPIAASAIEALKEYREICPFDTTKYLWLNYQGKRISRTSTYQITKKQDDIYPHMIRHSYATHMYNNGMDLMVLSQLLGHENIETTEIYLHVDNKQLHECIEKHHPINKVFPPSLN